MFDQKVKAAERCDLTIRSNAVACLGFDLLVKAAERNGCDLLAKAAVRNGFDLLVKAVVYNGV